MYGNIEMVNCCNLAKIQGSDIGGLINYDDISGTTTIVNCYNLGELIGKGRTSGIIGGAYNTGKRNIINTCSLGKVSKTNGTSQNFYYAWGGATVDLESCYYLDSIINENVTVNEKSISFSKSDESIIENLNTYVKNNKNNYAVELYSWELDEEGIPRFKK